MEYISLHGFLCHLYGVQYLLIRLYYDSLGNFVFFLLVNIRQFRIVKVVPLRGNTDK